MGRARSCIGLVLLALLAVAAFGVVRFMTGGEPSVDLPQTGDEVVDAAPRLGAFQSALGVDANGCPSDVSNQFYGDESSYVGLEPSFIPAGTEIFARLLASGQAVEDVDAIVAPADTEACVWFLFEPDAPYADGDYTAELIVNGNVAAQTSFIIGEPISSVPAEIGQLLVSTAVDDQGCPADNVGSFFPDEDIYAAVTESFVPEGTEIFARLYYNGQPFEDSDPITAEQDLQTCFWFLFETAGRNRIFDDGEYAVELIVNDEPFDSVAFAVDGTGVNLGEVVSTYEVDEATGCPVELTSEFFPEEDIYIAAAESIIPAGTEIFARLYFGGEPVEDTQPIVAEQDLQTCIWFVFEAARRNAEFPVGPYQAELIVNGSVAESVQFEVR